MSDTIRPQRIVISAASKPRLRPYAKLRHDAVRNRWTILAPERVYTPDATALAILELCNGERTVSEIAGELSCTYDAAQERIEADTISLLQQLADKGVITA
jgi:pyrroloquinoline quinone biosynthesis protein D